MARFFKNTNGFEFYAVHDDYVVEVLIMNDTKCIEKYILLKFEYYKSLYPDRLIETESSEFREAFCHVFDTISETPYSQIK